MPSTLAPKTPSKRPSGESRHVLPRQTKEAAAAKLRAFCANLKGRERAVIRKHHPQLLSPKN